MPKAQMSSYSDYAAKSQIDSDRGLFAGVPAEIQQIAPPDHKNIERLPPVHGSDLTMFVSDEAVAELTIRRLTIEIDQAKEELKELEESMLQELLKPSARKWLFPLMAVGLGLSLFGSLTAVNIAEMSATGLMLLWSLSAFWLIYTGDKQQEKARNAHRAEIEIWSSRIEELQQSLERNRRIIESAK